MAEQQNGMHAISVVDGLHPNPIQEPTVINFHRNLAVYMGECAQELLEPGQG